MSTNAQVAQPAAAQMTFGQVLAIPVMRRIWYAQIVSNFGDFLALYAVLSVASFRMHAQAAQLTWVQIAYMLPIAVLGPIAGVFVDRWPLKQTLVGSDLLRAGLTLGLMFATQLWHFYAVMALISVVSTFFGPAQGVTIRNAVPREGLMAANALMQQVMFGMRIVGPAAAGLLVASVGPRSCYLIDTLSFVGSAAFISSVAILRPETGAVIEGAETGIHKVWVDLKAGMKFIVHHAELSFVILALASGMFTMGCFGPLIAVYVRETLHGNVKLFGLMSALIPLGLLAGTSLIRKIADKVSSEVLVFSGLGGIAASLVILAAVPVIPAAAVGCLGIGFTVAAIIIPAQTLIQQETPAELMGRVGSTVMSVIFSAQVLGLLLSGALAQWTGVRQVFGLCAGFLVVLIGAGKLMVKHRGVGAEA